jgi:hypothetical protein
LGGDLNRRAGQLVYVGEHKTMKSAVPAAHEASWGGRVGIASSAIVDPGVICGNPALESPPAAISYKVITVTKGRLDRSLLP